MIDLGTTYLGLDLCTPLVVSASPISEDLDLIRRAEDAGAGAVVLPSLFEEQLTIDSHDLDHHLSRHAYSTAEALTYFPEPASYARGPEAYLAHVQQAKAAVDVPVIASLNGVSSGGWIEYARAIEQAGADALELNVYFVPTDPFVTGSAVESHVPRARPRRAPARGHPARRQAAALLQLHPEHGAPAGSGGGRRARALQPLLPAGLRPGRARGRPEPHPVEPGRAPAAAALGRHPVRARGGRSRRHRRRARRARRAEGDDGGGERRDDGLGPPAPRRGAPGDRACTTSIAGWKSASMRRSARCAAA